MFDFFNTIVNGFQQFLLFIKTAIESLVTGITFLITAGPATMSIINYMPTVIAGACLSFLAIFVLRFLLLK